MKPIKILLCALVLHIATTAHTQFIQTIAGKSNSVGGYAGDNGFARNDAEFNFSFAPAYDNYGNAYVPDRNNHLIRKIDANTGIITPYCGQPNQPPGRIDGVAPNQSKLNRLVKVLFDATGNMYIADTYNNRIRIINSAGTPTINTYAGGGATLGDGGAATSAKLSAPNYMVFGNNNNLYIGDKGNCRIRVVGSNGIINTFAGNGSSIVSGNNALATNAGLGSIAGLAYDAIGNYLYISSLTEIRRIDLSSGIISYYSGHTTMEGLDGQGDGGVAANARYIHITDLYCKDGKLYVSDMYDKRVRVINLSNNMVSTLVGGGATNSDGVSPLRAYIAPLSVVANHCGNIVIGDLHRLREIYPNPTGKIQHAKDYGTANYTPIKNVDMGYFKSPTLDPLRPNWNYSSTAAPDLIFSNNSIGNYFFQSHYPANVFFFDNALIPNKNNDVNVQNGVSVADIALIQNHMMGTTLFNNAFKCIAADVNNNGSISNIDIIYLKRFISGIPFNNSTTPKTWFPGGSAFPGGRLWAFAGKNTHTSSGSYGPFNNIIIGNNNPFINPSWYPNYKYYYGGTKIGSDGYDMCNLDDINFYGVKLGDVSWDWNPTLARGASPIELYFNQIDATELDNVTIPVRVNNFTDIRGMQFSLSFDPTHFEFNNFENDQLNFDFNSTQATTENNNGVISFVWTNDANEGVTLNNGSVLFYLTLHKKKSVKKDDLVLTSDLTKVEVINNDLELVPLQKKRSSIIDNTAGATDEYREFWDVLPNYSNMGNLFVKATSLSPKTVMLQVYNKEETLVFETPRTLQEGENLIYTNLRNVASLEQGVYYVKLHGMQDDESKPLFVGNLDEYATPAEIATGDITSVATSNATLALYSLQTQLYKTLMANPTLANTTDLQNFVTANATSNMNIIYTIENHLANGHNAAAAMALSNFDVSNAIDVNYKNYFTWVLKLINNEPFSTTDESNLNALVVQCPLTAGMVVFNGRDLSNCLTESNTQFGDVCPNSNNTSSRGTNNYVYKPTLVMPKAIDRSKGLLNNSLISMYPNPTKGLVHIAIPREEKGVWNIKVQDVMGRILQTKTTSAITKTMDLVVSNQTGLYYITLENKTTNKKIVEKVVVE